MRCFSLKPVVNRATLVQLDTLALDNIISAF
jgi:hypothetical protein